VSDAERRRSHRGASLTLFAVNFAAAAPALHQAGLNVLPVAAETKRPLIPWSKWQSERQSRADLDALRRAHPDAAAAVVLGGPALMLADVETDSAAGERSLRKAGLPLPVTAVFSSPRGSHRLYRSAGRLPRRVGALQGVDLLGSGYVIVPPSAGRSWVLDLAHLQDLPPEWAEVAYHRRRRVGAPEPPSALPSASTPHPKSRYSKRLHIQSLAALVSPGSDMWTEVCGRLGVPAEVGRAFRCPLPGHDERRASAAWHLAENGVPVLMDFHRRGGAPAYALVEVYASVRAGRAQKLSPVSYALWAARLSCELRLSRPAAVSLPPLPRDTSRAMRLVYDGVRLLFGVRWLHSPGAPAPLSWRFLSSWCGVNQRTAAAALAELLRLGIIVKAGTWQHTTLFLPTNIDSKRGAS
jgi:hypothetical protein